MLKWLGWLWQSQSMGEVPGLTTCRFVNESSGSCTMTCYSNSRISRWRQIPCVLLPYQPMFELSDSFCAMPRLLPPHPVVQGGQRCRAARLRGMLTEATEDQRVNKHQLSTRLDFVSRWGGWVKESKSMKYIEIPDF